jgi:uncharacterized repeat protein (TIGR01451 family)
MSQSISRRCVFGFALLILSLLAANAAYAQATLSMSLAVSPTFDIDINGNLTYTASVTNTGTLDAPNLTVTFTMTAWDFPISPAPSGGCIFTPGTANLTAMCSIPLLNPGQSHDFVIVVHPFSTGAMDVTAAAHEDGGGTASAFVTSNIIEVGLSDVRVTMTATSPGKVGEPLTYTVTVYNIQDDDAANVFAVLVLPKKATFVSATNGCTHGTLALCKIGTLAPGTGKTVSVTVLPTLSGWTEATAGVRLTTPDRDATNNSAASIVFVNP